MHPCIGHSKSLWLCQSSSDRIALSEMFTSLMHFWDYYLIMIMSHSWALAWPSSELSLHWML